MRPAYVALIAASLLLMIPEPACCQSKPAVSQNGPSTEAGGTTASATTNDEGPAGIVPYVKGFNLSFSTISQHDSSNGWSSLVFPNMAYRFNRHFSIDAGAAVFTYLNVLTAGGTVARPTETYKTRHLLAEDTSLNGHYETSLKVLDYNITATLGLPTGDTQAGLGAGQVTYNFNNHFEKPIGRFSPNIELGIGDSNSLVTERLRKQYTTVGRLAHFQAGTTVDLPFNTSFSADAYEELPISSQTVYTTTTIRKRSVTTGHTESAAEDNGFLTSLDIPLNPHTVLSGFYNRSLRGKVDTAGFSFTFFLRAVPKQIVH